MNFSFELENILINRYKRYIEDEKNNTTNEYWAFEYLRRNPLFLRIYIKRFSKLRNLIKLYKRNKLDEKDISDYNDETRNLYTELFAYNGLDIFRPAIDVMFSKEFMLKVFVYDNKNA